MRRKKPFPKLTNKTARKKSEKPNTSYNTSKVLTRIIPQLTKMEGAPAQLYKT